MIQIFAFNKDTPLQKELNQADFLSLVNEISGIENDLALINENNVRLNTLYEAKKVKDITPLLITANNKSLLFIS